MSDLRRGFFCILCDARTQSKLADFSASTNLFYQDRIYFSKEFCRKLVDHTIRASYYTENLAITKLVYEIAYCTCQQLKNCFFFKNKYFFFFCENYGERLRLTKPVDFMAGALINLKKFVGHISKYRANVFYYPSINLLMDGMTNEESFMAGMCFELFGDIISFRAGSPQQVLLCPPRTQSTNS